MSGVGATFLCCLCGREHNASFLNHSEVGELMQEPLRVSMVYSASIGCYVPGIAVYVCVSVHSVLPGGLVPEGLVLPM